MTGPPEKPNPAGNEASGAQISNQAGRQVGQANTPNGTAAPVPYFVAVDGDERAGIVHVDMFGQWHAANWTGAIGVYPDEGLAVAAIVAAPKRPRAPKPQKPPKPEPPKFVEADTAGRVFRGKRQIGGWIKTADGFAAWTRQGKAGVCATVGLAANAVLSAFLEDRSAKAHADLRKGNWP
jgi:hypothetical protein